jgi:hypothetical protein
MSKAAGRDLEAELNDGRGSPVGLAVDAVCTGCKQTRAKRIIGGEPDDPPTSVQHVCHQCQQETWWNVRRVLRGYYQ